MERSHALSSSGAAAGILADRVACPYCANPDRNRVFEDAGCCRYDASSDRARGLLYPLPPCACDAYARRVAGNAMASFPADCAAAGERLLNRA